MIGLLSKVRAWIQRPLYRTWKVPLAEQCLKDLATFWPLYSYLMNDADSAFDKKGFGHVHDEVMRILDRIEVQKAEILKEMLEDK